MTAFHPPHDWDCPVCYGAGRKSSGSLYPPMPRREEPAHIHWPAVMIAVLVLTVSCYLGALAVFGGG